MGEIERNKDITTFTTFRIPVRARYFAEYDSEKSLRRIMRTREYFESERLHIGGGSNLLFLDDYPGMVLHSAIKGIKAYRKNESTLYVITGGGERWIDFVDWCVANGYAGVENLAAIPGEVGASVVQNVGAYGVEAADVIHSVECFDLYTGELRTFVNSECGFSYRDSIFKHEYNGRYAVLRVCFRLNPDGVPQNLSYGPLKTLADRLGHIPSIEEVKNEVSDIRASKLPDTSEIGSAGSFFKNPVISRDHYEYILKHRYPDMPVYPVDDSTVKLSAGWLIEHAGLSDYRYGNAGVYPRQCLVIANFGGATAAEVEQVSDYVRATVRRIYGISLSPEVNFIDTRVRVTVLGSGTSKGVPEIGCDCEVCTSGDSRDKRMRASVLVETAGKRILIDAGPDFRSQILRAGINNLDAVLFTHEHYDHVGGIDDLRPLVGERRFPLYMRSDVSENLHHRLDYCFRENLYPGVPAFDVNIIDKDPFFVDGVEVIPVEVLHHKLPVVGFRIRNFAYITDCKTITDEELEKLSGLDVLIVNALRYKNHFSHMNVDEALNLIEKIKPGHAYLTHIGHDMGGHAEIDNKLPENVSLAYDGLKFIC